MNELDNRFEWPAIGILLLGYGKESSDPDIAAEAKRLHRRWKLMDEHWERYKRYRNSSQRR